MSDLSGSTIGAYRIDRPIGRGGMGVVYAAVDTRLGRRVAIKSVRPELSSDKAFRRRLRREARHVANVSHPNVAALYDVVEEREHLLLVLEYVDGEPLDRAFRHDPSPDRLRRFAREIAGALTAIHRAGLVHLDLKPSNVRVDRDDRVRVLDFGVALRLAPGGGASHASETPTETMTGQGTTRGTIAYMSPEQLRNAPVDERSDLFALGVVLFELANGRHPFKRASVSETAAAILKDATPRFGRESARDHPRIERLVHGLLEKWPEDRRPDSARGVAEILEGVRSTGSARGSTRVRRASIAASIAVTAVFVGLVVVYSGWELPFGRYGEEPTARRTVVITGVTTGDAELDAWRAPFRRALIDRLSSFALVPEAKLATVRYTPPKDLAFDAVACELRTEVHERVASCERIPSGGVARETTTHRAETWDGLAREAARAIAGLGTARDGDEAVGDGPTVDDPVLAELDAAESAFERFDVPTAIGHAERANTLDPSQARGDVVLVHAWFRAGYEERAERLVRALAERLDAASPKVDPFLRRRIAVARAWTANDFAGALEPLVELHRIRPDDRFVRDSLARAYRLNGLEPLALETLGDLDSTDVSGWLEAAGVHIDTREPDLAREALRHASEAIRALGRDEAVGPLEERYGLLAFRSGDLEEAAERYRTAADAYFSNGMPVAALRALKSRGDALLRSWKLDDALDVFRHVLAEAPRDGHASLACSTANSLGALHLRRDALRDARAAFETAIDEAEAIGREDLTFSPLINLLTIATLDGNLDRARRLAGRVIELAERRDARSRLQATRMRLADVELFDGHVDRARNLLETLSADSNLASSYRASVYQRLARVEWIAGAYGRSIAHADRATELKRAAGDRIGVAYSLALRGYARALSGDVERARADLESARTASTELERFPEVAELVDLLEWVASVSTLRRSPLPEPRSEAIRITTLERDLWRVVVARCRGATSDAASATIRSRYPLAQKRISLAAALDPTSACRSGTAGVGELDDDAAASEDGFTAYRRLVGCCPTPRNPR